MTSVAGTTKSASIQNWLLLGQLRSEKCELAEARIAYEMALKHAKRQNDLRGIMEALSGLLRLSSEAYNTQLITETRAELQKHIDRARELKEPIPPTGWYCQAVTAYSLERFNEAQRYVRIYIRELIREKQTYCNRYPEIPVGDEGDEFQERIRQYDLAEAKGWALLVFITVIRGMIQRAWLLVDTLLARYEHQNLRSMNGMLYLAKGGLLEMQKNYDEAYKYFQKAHGAFLGEHNWFYHLYVLFGYARIARYQKKFQEAYWHLDLIEKVAQGPEFGLIQHEIKKERERLQNEAIDLLIDSRHCLIKTKDDREIALGKQYVLLQILEALYLAHREEGDSRERGLSKAEIIQYVWSEKYRPEAHDNKLYYNINRLRKLIEPDVKNPTYLLNWKEGYRLAPGLKVQFIGGKGSNDSSFVPNGASESAANDGGRNAQTH